jgi:hypothetical protein
MLLEHSQTIAKRPKKKSKGVGIDLLELRNRLAKKVRPEDRIGLQLDGSVLVNDADEL